MSVSRVRRQEGGRIKMGKKIVLTLFCVILLATLAGCATVTSDNSFQEMTPVQESQTQAQTSAQPVNTQAPAVVAPDVATPENSAAPEQAVTPGMPTRDPNGSING